MIEIGLLSKRYGNGDLVLREVSLTVEDGEFFTLLGPSGCGKTTLLRCIAGLEQAEVGRIEINGVTVFDAAGGVLTPPHRRNIGMVFQSYAIWPHMTVLENVAFPARAKRLSDPRRLAMAALEKVGLGHLAGRSATRLSGGQQQRVALARALIGDPDVLLLDEPLSNLDAGLREQMRGELRRLQSELGVTTVLVTHDQAEALSMSDRLAVLDHGVVVETGTPEEIYQAPKTRFAARFVGEAVELSGTLRQGGGGEWLLDTPLGTFDAPGRARRAGPATAFLRTEALAAHAEEPPGARTIRARCLQCRFLGGEYEHDVSTETEPSLLLRVRSRTRYSASQALFLEVTRDSLLLPDDETEPAKVRREPVT